MPRRRSRGSLLAELLRLAGEILPSLFRSSTEDYVELARREIDELRRKVRSTLDLKRVSELELKRRELEEQISKLFKEQGDWAWKYTIEQTIGHITATEDHLRVEKDADFCIRCLLEKHLPALLVYASEGVTFARSDEERKLYQELASVVRDMINLGTSNKEEFWSRRLEFSDKLRSIRKQLALKLMS